MDSFNEAWGYICDYCKTKMGEVAYKTWISRIKPVNIDFNNGEAILMVPNDFHKQTLTRCYVPLLNEAIGEIIGPGFNIVFTVPQSSPKPVQAIVHNPNDKSSDETVPVQRTSGELTFQNFIVGSSNKFAHAAAQAVANNPGSSYNPLFIYGNSGLGKTHLLYAIGNDIKKTYNNMNVLYVKGEDFTNELISSLQSNKMVNFRQKYRNTDVLLIDDVQFIGGKESTQEEFFHTFNTLYEAQKQIVLTSDRSPKEIKTLEDRIRNRFEWGLLADVQPPDIETRMAIINKKAEMIDFKISREMTEYIATKLTTNIRQIEGVVKKLKAKSMLAGEKLTITIINDAIKDIIDQPDGITKPLTIEKIIEEVAKTYNVSPEDIKSPRSRKANLAHARQIAIYITREITHLSLTKIAEEFGGRHYSTIIYSIKEIEKEIKQNEKTNEIIEDIIKNINSNS